MSDLVYEASISRVGHAEEGKDEAEQKHAWTEHYYSQVLQKSSDLKTDACCTPLVDKTLIPYLKNIHPDITSSYYGCGLVIPKVLRGKRILDLGCGTGRDVYLLSQLVGPTGMVHGVDMSDEQLVVARRHQDYHAQFSGGVVNTAFTHSRLESACLEVRNYDVIVSNCVINLCPDKRAVLRGAYDMLTQGGELYFSDVYASARVPKDLVDDSDLWGECLSGALYWNDFLRLAKEVGFADPRLVSDSPIGVQNKELEEKIAGRVQFYSATYRLFKISELEPDCEDYGQAVIYKGGIVHAEEAFMLDDHHTFIKDKIHTVCGNTWRMLQQTRFEPYFEFIGNFSKHYGLFEGCGKYIPFSRSASSTGRAAANPCC